MIKKFGTIGVFFIFICTISAQDLPKVAVLDATLGEGVDHNAAAIVADTINEQFVRSPDYRVTDRAYISSIQEEKKFQLSGEVDEDDIKALGETFGADFICAPHVSVLGTTYTISARLISVETAEVFSQESRRMKGDMDVLFLLAEFVGAGLAGTDPTSSELASDNVPEKVEEEETPDATYTPPEQPTPTYTPPERKSGALGDTKSHLILSWVIPTYTGLENCLGSYALWQIDEYFIDYYTYDDVYTESFGLDIHYLETFLSYGYFSLGMTFTKQDIVYESGSYVYQQGNLMTLEPYLGIGGIIAPLSFLDVYAGMNLGYMVLILGTGYSQDATDDLWTDSGDGASAVSFALEIGSDIYLGSIGLSLKYKYSYAEDLSGEYMFEDYFTSADNNIGVGSLMIGAGFYF